MMTHITPKRYPLTPQWQAALPSPLSLALPLSLRFASLSLTTRDRFKPGYEDGGRLAEASVPEAEGGGIEGRNESGENTVSVKGVSVNYGSGSVGSVSASTLQSGVWAEVSE